jgi:hypothetical protein
MPRKPEWYQQIPSALALLRTFPAPVVDRAALETLLHVGRREAIRLMHRFGGYQAGRTFLIGREDLSRQLEGIRNGDAYQWESRRRERLDQTLKTMRRVVIQVTNEVKNRKLLDLPPGVELERNRLEIHFESAEDLLSKLFEFSRTISEDYDSFCSLIDKT